MKRFINTVFLLAAMLWNLSCGSYLDIVPDNTVTLEDYFSRREMAWNSLAKVYSYLPADPNTHSSSWLLGDEWVATLVWNMVGEDYFRATKIMRGLQNEENPLLGLWSGTLGGKALYAGIRNADIFLEYIDMVEDMAEQEIAEWKAQVKFLKAYYSFLLLRQYGPIVIVNEPVEIDALSDELFKQRSKVEDCFDFVIRLIDEAIPDLKEGTDITDLGQVNKMIALSIKARVLLYRASPFFNGNSEFYGDFLDHNGEPFFPLEYNHEKWKDALDAVEEAIKFGETNGYGLYRFDGVPYMYDRMDYALRPEEIQTLYDLRMVIADPWNKELIWGQTYSQTSTDALAHHSNIYLPTDYGSGITNNTSMSGQLLGATYKMLERYYTKNGLPISDDITFGKNMVDIVSTPGVEDPAYEPLRGFMQPGAQTITLYMDREPRFYANMGVVGGYWRAHAERIPTQFFAGSYGGYARDDAYLVSGIGVQKFVHPESKSGRWERAVRSPYPIIRMADLYLMKAEILNEYLDAPNSEVYENINKVRARAGISDVQTSWSNPLTVNPRSLNKHLTKDGMREIILQERSIELAFEGIRFWDMHRHKMAVSEFSSPAMGWNCTGFSPESFFILRPIEYRRFIERDYLWPLGLNEININGNLIQNPGW
jgi:hypothetical protein